jgi:hypothetical protein
LHNQDKCLHFAGRQLTFLKSIVVCESFDILQIDNKAIGLQGRTLRDLILEIPLRDSGRQTFLSVDCTFNGSSVKLVCYEKHQSECRNRLATLLPFLIFTNPTLEKGIRGCFSADANERALGAIRSRTRDAESEEESDDTPKTINRNTPTAQTEAISSLSEGPSTEIKNYLDQMTNGLIQLTTIIPNTPENQAALTSLRALLPTSQRAGCSSDSQGLGSSGSGALPR